MLCVSKAPECLVSPLVRQAKLHIYTRGWGQYVNKTSCQYCLVVDFVTMTPCQSKYRHHMVGMATYGDVGLVWQRLTSCHEEEAQEGSYEEEGS